MNSSKYTKIIDSNLNPSAEKLGLNSFTFQQDNDPKHRSVHTKGYFDDRKIKVISWPFHLPDMNPIEYLWSELKRRVRARMSKNMINLKSIVMEEWDSIRPETCQKLVLSMLNRAEMLYRSKGCHTSY